MFCAFCIDNNVSNIGGFPVWLPKYLIPAKHILLNTSYTWRIHYIPILNTSNAYRIFIYLPNTLYTCCIHYIPAEYIIYLPNTSYTCRIHYIPRSAEYIIHLLIYILCLPNTSDTCRIHHISAEYIRYLPIALYTCQIHYIPAKYIMYLRRPKPMKKSLSERSG